MERGKKRVFPNFQEVEEEDDQLSQTNPKRICNSFLTGSEAESAIHTTQPLSPQSWSQMKVFLCQLVNELVDSKFKANNSSSNSQLKDQKKEATVAGFETRLKLCFLNQIASTIFTNNEVEAENGVPLQVALVDVTNFNAIVSIGPLSMAQIELVVLDGDASEFEQSILSPRVGKRPLLVGNDLKLDLNNGVGLIKNLSVTDNSSWLRSKKFRLGARITDEKILAKFPSIGEAVSQPFRVLEGRGELNKKHHPPKREDEVWRLEGISKNGVCHNNLASKGIKTVDDFLKIYNEKGPLYLKKLLGKKVSNKTWKAMVLNALECVVPVTNFAPNFEMKNLVGNEAFEGTTPVGFGEEWEPMPNFEDPSLFPPE